MYVWKLITMLQMKKKIKHSKGVPALVIWQSTYGLVLSTLQIQVIRQSTLNQGLKQQQPDSKVIFFTEYKTRN